MTKNNKIKTKEKTPVDRLLAKNNVDNICAMIIAGARIGETLGIVLYNLGIPSSRWLPYMKKNKKVQLTVSDATEFHKAYGQIQLKEMAYGNKRHSAKMAEIMLVNFYDIKNEYVINEISKKPSKPYKVVTQMVEKKTLEVEHG